MDQNKSGRYGVEQEEGQQTRGRKTELFIPQTAAPLIRGPGGRDAPLRKDPLKGPDWPEQQRHSPFQSKSQLDCRQHARVSGTSGQTSGKTTETKEESERWRWYSRVCHSWTRVHGSSSPRGNVSFVLNSFAFILIRFNVVLGNFSEAN